ncbi:MAG: sensor histidine kinase [Chitinophagales bacterium]|nr:sensor histidine kinase [Chitinophagales bacterium]
MRKILLAVVFYILTPHLFSQQIDSLIQVSEKKNIPDTQRVNVLNELCRELVFVDPTRAARYAHDALQLSYRIQYLKGQAYGYRGLSSIYSTHGKTVIASEYLLKALELFESLGDSTGIANCYITMGHAFRRAQNRTEEIRYHKNAFEIFSRLKLPARIAVTAHNLGESYQLTGEAQKSRELTLYAIHLTDSLQLLSVLSNCYKVMGKLEQKAGNLLPAENYFKQVLALSDRLGVYSQKTATVEALTELAAISGLNGQAEQQLAYLQSAAAFSEKNLLVSYLREIYSNLISLHAGNKEKVEQYISAYRKAADTLVARNLANQSAFEDYANEVYKYHKKETGKLVGEVLLQQQRIKNKSLFLTLALIAGIILSGLLLQLLRVLRRLKKTEQEAIKNKNELRELAIRLQTVREEERTLIAREIHEGLGQQLTVIKMDVSWIRNNLGTSDENIIQKAEAANALLDKAVNEVRKIASSLRPGMLDDLGLDIAIQWALAEFEKEQPVNTYFEVQGDTQALSNDVKTGLFRIFQEALSNVGRHAAAKKVTTRLFVEEEEAELQIEDDGKGFDANETASKKNIGFLSIKERCYMMNGSFEVKSSKGKGTTVTVKVAL